MYTRSKVIRTATRFGSSSFRVATRFVDLPELGEPGNNVSQSGYVVVVERPGPPADLNCLRIVAQLVMSGCQPGKPDEQARIARAEADTSLDARHRLLRLTPRVKHRAEHGVSRGKAWIQLDRFLEFCHRAIGARRPHADQSERKVGVRIPAVERRGALRQLERFLIILFGIIAPAQIGRSAQCDRQRRGGLDILRVDRQRTTEIALRLDVIRLVLAVGWNIPR